MNDQIELDIDFIQSVVGKVIYAVTSTLGNSDIPEDEWPAYASAILAVTAGTVGGGFFDDPEQKHLFNEHLLDTIAFHMDVSEGNIG